ncbi:hypothetical protein GCM10023185_29640 [Hymenobacter saemangeumensis]|uniref:Uncharacterized protein n=1 Tax=Hymenobacter saemangeumensis TaxID=1084522 RepID=A0ABP8IM33_9BACT
MKTNTIPQNATEKAIVLGFPATLFGFTPDQRGYWFEPGLPWTPQDMGTTPPIDKRGLPGVWLLVEFGNNSMAPRFPAGTVVNLTPVFTREQLTVGKVYAYLYTNHVTGKQEMCAGRLAVIGDSCLEATRDNGNPREQHMLWPLREAAGEETWGVYEVSHYQRYPELG